MKNRCNGFNPKYIATCNSGSNPTEEMKLATVVTMQRIGTGTVSSIFKELVTLMCHCLVLVWGVEILVFHISPRITTI